MKKIVNKMIIVSVILFFLFLNIGCISNEEHYSTDNPHFLIDIIIDYYGKDSYYLYLPIPVIGYANWVFENEGEPLKEISKLNISSGTGIIDLITVNGEYFLNISSNNSIEIRYFIKKNLPDPFESLSSEMLYFSGINKSISLNYSIEYYSGNREFKWELENEDILNGWQIALIRPELLIVD